MASDLEVLQGHVSKAEESVEAVWWWAESGRKENSCAHALAFLENPALAPVPCPPPSSPMFLGAVAKRLPVCWEVGTLGGR